jgi:hypothetical protein
MSSRDEYRRLASECLAVAGRMKTREARLLLIEMARVWLRLANEGRAPTPLGPAADPVQPTRQQQQQWQQPKSEGDAV